MATCIIPACFHPSCSAPQHGVSHARSWDRVYTRTSLGLLGVIAVVLGLVAGYGLTMAIGLPFTSLEQTLPYILEGIGLDVIFILVKGEPCTDAPR